MEQVLAEKTLFHRGLALRSILSSSYSISRRAEFLVREAETVLRHLDKTLPRSSMIQRSEQIAPHQREMLRLRYLNNLLTSWRYTV